MGGGGRAEPEAGNIYRMKPFANKFSSNSVVYISKSNTFNCQLSMFYSILFSRLFHEMHGG